MARTTTSRPRAWPAPGLFPPEGRSRPCRPTPAASVDGIGPLASRSRSSRCVGTGRHEAERGTGSPERRAGGITSRTEGETAIASRESLARAPVARRPGRPAPSQDAPARDLPAQAAAAPPAVAFSPDGQSIVEAAPEPQANGETFDKIEDNPFQPIDQEPLSTFSIDVDTASYANVRRFLIQRTSCRPGTRSGSRSCSTTSPTTTRPRRRAVPTRSRSTSRSPAAPGTPTTGWPGSASPASPIDPKERPPSNLVFLIDVSGSMDRRQQAAAGQVVARRSSSSSSARTTGWRSSSTPSASGLVLPSTSCHQQGRDPLGASTSSRPAARPTAARGIQLAYDVAVRELHQGRRQPRHPGHRRRLQRRHHRARAS